jgi:nucleotide-binding universal stress UspA family protein
MVMSAVRRVVVAVDFSTSSREAVAFARACLRGCHDHLHLVYVLTDIPQTRWLSEAGASAAQLHRRRLAGAEERLVAFAAGLDLESPTTAMAVAVGVPDEEIVRYAREHGADAIVLGSQGHGRIRHFLFGSVTKRVVRDAPCPVIVLTRCSLRAALPPEPLVARRAVSCDMATSL